MLATNKSIINTGFTTRLPRFFFKVPKTSQICKNGSLKKVGKFKGKWRLQVHRTHLTGNNNGSSFISYIFCFWSFAWCLSQVSELHRKTLQVGEFWSSYSKIIQKRHCFTSLIPQIYNWNILINKIILNKIIISKVPRKIQTPEQRQNFSKMAAKIYKDGIVYCSKLIQHKYTSSIHNKYNLKQ